MEDRKAKHGSSATSSGAAGGGDGGAGGLEQDGAARGAVGLGDLGQLVGDDLPRSLLVAEDRVELLDRRARSSSCSFSSSIRENLVSRRSGMSRM